MAKKSIWRPWMFRKEIMVLYFGLQDKRTKIWSKIPVLIALIYLLSPVDLVPDFIPFFGYLDDLIVVPLLINLSVQLLPGNVREESMVKAKRHRKKFQIFFILGIVLLLALLAMIFFLIRQLIFYH